MGIIKSRNSQFAVRIPANDKSVITPRRKAEKMKILSLIVFQFLSLSIALAQFEGALDMKMSAFGSDGARQTMNYTLMLKGTMVEATFRGSGNENEGKFIYRGDRNIIWVIDDENGSYLEMTLNPDDLPHSPGKKSGESVMHPRKTGRTRQILGYTCDEYVAVDSAGSTSIWTTPKLGGVYEGLNKAFGELAQIASDNLDAGDWSAEMSRLKLFPLDIERSVNGAVAERQEVTRIEPKNLPAPLFEIPEGYSKQPVSFDMEKVLEQLRQSGVQVEGDSAMQGKDLEKMLNDVQDRLKHLEENSPAGTDTADDNHH